MRSKLISRRKNTFFHSGNQELEARAQTAEIQLTETKKSLDEAKLALEQMRSEKADKVSAS
jgi:hypothetical protein